MKTLKEFTKFEEAEPYGIEADEEGCFINVDNLRESAIEDAKEIREQINNLEPMGYVPIRMNLDGNIKYIMEKFNLTEEDMK